MTNDDMNLVGEAGNGEEAVRLCEKLQPDVVLMDLMMPVMDGVAATAAIKKQWPQTNIIALTSFKEKEMVEGALKAGALSYLLKNVSASELITAIRGAVCRSTQAFSGSCSSADSGYERTAGCRLMILPTGKRRSGPDGRRPAEYRHCRAAGRQSIDH